MQVCHAAALAVRVDLWTGVRLSSGHALCGVWFHIQNPRKLPKENHIEQMITCSEVNLENEAGSRFLYPIYRTFYEATSLSGEKLKKRFKPSCA